MHILARAASRLETVEKLSRPLKKPKSKKKNERTAYLSYAQKPDGYLNITMRSRNVASIKELVVKTRMNEGNFPKVNIYFERSF